VAQEMLGHSNVTVILDTYLHLLPNMQDEVAEKVSECSLDGCSTVAVRSPRNNTGRLLYLSSFTCKSTYYERCGTRIRTGDTMIFS
jgi:hypothetical protein